MLVNYTLESAMPGSFEEELGARGLAVLPPPTLSSPPPPTLSSPLPPMLGALSRSMIPASRSSHQTSSSGDDPSLGEVKRSSKVRVVEIPRQPPVAPHSQLYTFLHLQHSKVESRRVRAALEDHETTANQYEHDKLQEISAAHAVTERDLRDTIDNRLREISSLKQDVGQKNAMIEGIGRCCDELNTALAEVRGELEEEREKLKAEREKAKAEREEGIRDLEARLLSSIQQSHAATVSSCLALRTPQSRPTSNAPNDEPMNPNTAPSCSPRTRSGIVQPARRAESLSTFTTPQVSSREHVNSASQRHALSVPAPNEADRNREQGSSASGLSASGQLPLPQWSLSDDPSTQSPSPPIRLPPLLPQTQRQHAQLQAVQKAVSAERERFKKTDDRNAHLTQVRRLFSDVFQAPADEDFYSVHVAAPREEVDRYLDGEGPGPDTGDLHFTDLEPYNNAWNCAVSRHLAHMVWDRQSTERWTTKKGGRAASASEAYWEDLILQKFKRVRKGWMDAQRKVVQDPATGQSHIESLEEAETRHFGKGEETRTVARQRERRFTRWERRTGICTTKMQLATVPFEKTRWTEFLKIIDILGKDGMSSDESTEEEVAKLPAAFYNDDWISTRSDEYVHGVLYGSDQGYEWVIRVAEAYNGRAANNS
ncbi:hypothetical protein GSI_09431 [Ganoderma sinense ZZ0214-1]|uniref:Uncharacterized protein n=1 Tax=Ganoderma sinense ZZ0214-1 TaxID=1077348 RepID=A0A2G8S6H3_9APHY|nr:hypothetical protein GSI_09431 [Ganoderma sinense ZZ0214-1]